jgi:type IV pilus assembly protein PilV
MKLKTSELGIGMVEVLVALVLLAIGVLGYTALQLRAVDASNEALTRSQATVLLRSLTESMRANNGGQSSYPQLSKVM